MTNTAKDLSFAVFLFVKPQKQTSLVQYFALRWCLGGALPTLDRYLLMGRYFHLLRYTKNYAHSFGGIAKSFKK